MITNSRITCGDDCISIQTGTSNVQILHSECGPSHGISIGGLGQRHSFAQVNDILVDHVNLIGTMNGLRIKTWQGGQGWASRVSYQNVRMLNVSNPIIIDQFYCDSSRPCNIQPSAVQINQVSYKNVTGSSSNPVAISFECSASVPCRNLLLESIQLLALWPGQRTVSRCHNARGISVGNVAPGSCLD
ncbi:hypothetical protein O6H91_15G060500 [Diphasiastrum complanatum]|uniref:Uncharacterized protein n=1 Tax=Diphasiastrum complanatum TaxID=34168 RepID=A0ACC2BIV6_DIPCM|nr:hypothetical protein O6H91_15G060500 [Diphasiastrum complanatum]